MDNEVAYERSEGTATGSEPICQVRLSTRGDLVGFGLVVNDLADDLVCSHEVDQFVCQHVQFDQGGVVVSSQAFTQIYAVFKCCEVAEVDAAHVIFEDLRILVFEVGWL